jgi:hypothetical protein
MVRHPHFTQPIFVRFPRPAVLTGREGAERFPQSEEVTLESAVLRDLRRLDPSITLSWVQDMLALHEEADVLSARDATLRERPADVKGFFKSRFKGVVRPRTVVAPTPVAMRSAPPDDPYGF